MPDIQADPGGVPIQTSNLIERKVPVLDVLCILDGVIRDDHILIVGTKK
jgi:hypothetical protein